MNYYLAKLIKANSSGEEALYTNSPFFSYVITVWHKARWNKHSLLNK